MMIPNNMNDNLYIDTYSDDLSYLNNMYEIFFSHPYYNFSSRTAIPSITRIFIVFMIGCIESMIEEVVEKSLNTEEYLRRHTTNERKIEILENILRNTGIDIERSILDDYLAIKYIRNNIIHSGVKNLEFVATRDFPKDVRQLDIKHLERIQGINKAMINALGIFGMAYQHKNSFSDRIKITATSYKLRLSEESRFFTDDKLASLIWSNFKITLTNLSNRYHQEQGITDISSIESNWTTEQFLKEAVVSWNRYYTLFFHSKFIDENRISNISNLLDNLCTRQDAPFLKFNDINTSVEYWKTVSEIYKKDGLELEFNPNEVYQAILDAEYIYDMFPDIVPATLFGIFAPRIDPSRAFEYKNIFRLVSKLTKINIMFYAFRERLIPERCGINNLFFIEKLSDRLELNYYEEKKKQFIYTT